MAVITKADIITDVNENLQVEFATDGTDLDRAINKVLNDMSNRGLLVDKDSTQTLSDGGLTLNHPTGFRHAIAITLTDADGNNLAPLRKLPGGHVEYRELRKNDDSTGPVEFYSDFNEQFFLWHPAGKAYTSLIEFRKNHPKDPDNIEFETKFENLMFAGATLWKAAALTRTRAVGIWAPIYANELNWASLNRNTQPSIVGNA